MVQEERRFRPECQAKTTRADECLGRRHHPLVRPTLISHEPFKTARLTHPRSMVNLQPDGWPGIGRQNRQPPFLPGMYSASLSNFIAQCVRYNPTGTIGRPTVAQALNQIRNNPLVPGHDNFQSMETADPGVHLSRSTNPHRLQHFRPHDRYRLGLRREQMPKM